MAVLSRPSWRQVLLSLVLAVTLYAVIPQLGSFKHSVDILRSSDKSLVAMALICFATTYFSAAATYCLLAFKRLSYYRTVMLQLAGMFVNRLLPAGLGAMGINYAYLHKQGHSTSQAGIVVALNNILGFLGHGILFTFCFIIAAGNLPPLSIHAPHFAFYWWLLSGAAVFVALYALLPRLRHRLQAVVSEAQAQLYSYRDRRLNFAGALLTSMALTLSHALTLALCLLSVNASLPLTAIIIILGVGVAFGSATPTPGGLGGVEAGLLAGFIAFGVSAATALAAILLYRLITYWLALICGAVAFGYAQNAGLLRFKS